MNNNGKLTGGSAQWVNEMARSVGLFSYQPHNHLILNEDKSIKGKYHTS
ncbi:hypothetical protein [Saccharicrinis carchari]|nr:hypothetical protein [Saccharicrinis carchari]